MSGFVCAHGVSTTELRRALGLIGDDLPTTREHDGWSAAALVRGLPGLDAFLSVSGPVMVGYGDGVEAELPALDRQWTWAASPSLRSAGVMCAPGHARLWVDVTGGCPMYVGFRVDDTPVIASEAKIVAALVGAPLRLPDATRRRAPHTTIFQGVHRVQPGHVVDMSLSPLGWWVEDAGSSRVLPRRPAVSTLTEARHRLDEALRASVESCVADLQTVGVALSGGVDSSLVTALAVRAGVRVRSFAVGSEFGAEFAEASYAARTLGTEHGELMMTRDQLRELLPRLMWALETTDLPTLQIAAPAAFLHQQVAGDPSVFLTGYGADLLFAGVLDPRCPEHVIERRTRQQVAATVGTNEFAPGFASRHGTTVRYPYWTAPFLDAALQLRGRLKTKDDTPKFILRDVASAYLPREIAWRPKLGIHEGSAMPRLFASALGCRPEECQAALNLMAADLFAPLRTPSAPSMASALGASLAMSVACESS